MKQFKPHMMYDKSGKAYKANTYEQHLAMKKKGYGHAKPASKPSTKSSTKKKAKNVKQPKKIANKTARYRSKSSILKKARKK